MPKKETIFIKGYKRIPYQQDTIYTDDEMVNRSKSFYEWLNNRRSVRKFSGNPVSKTIVKNLILSASTAQAGANKQPWTFCTVSNLKLNLK